MSQKVNHVSSVQVPGVLCKTLQYMNKSKLQETPSVYQYPSQLNYRVGHPHLDNLVPCLKRVFICHDLFPVLNIFNPDKKELVMLAHFDSQSVRTPHSNPQQGGKQQLLMYASLKLFTLFLWLGGGWREARELLLRRQMKHLHQN